MPRLHGGTIATLGLCAYCEAPTDMTCRLCGRAMCPDHTEGELVCLGCATGRADE